MFSYLSENSVKARYNISRYYGIDGLPFHNDTSLFITRIYFRPRLGGLGDEEKEEKKKDKSATDDNAKQSARIRMENSVDYPRLGELLGDITKR